MRKEDGQLRLDVDYRKLNAKQRTIIIYRRAEKCPHFTRSAEKECKLMHVCIELLRKLLLELSCQILGNCILT